jgi:hypothetical protein
MKVDMSIWVKTIPVHRRLLLFSLALISASGGYSFAQDCGQEINVATLIQEAGQSCNGGLVYKAWTIAGEQIIPQIRSLSSIDCGPEFRLRVDIALAKLGDPAPLERLRESLGREKVNTNILNTLEIVGNDQAISILMTYLESNGFGIVRRNDYAYYPSEGVVRALQSISRRREILDLPSQQFDLSPQESFVFWSRWWGEHKGGRISVAPYERISDPYLKCLARKVDWGAEAAILSMAGHPGEAAESALRLFPRSDRTEPWGTVQGYVQAALAKMGNKEAFGAIEDELVHGAYPDAIAKFEYVGGRDAVDILVNALGIPTQATQNAQKLMDQCIQNHAKGKWRNKAEEEESIQKNCVQFYGAAVNGYPEAILRGLGHMVKDPPIPADSPPTSDNFQKWKDWWKANQDKTEFTQVKRNIPD